MLDYAKTQHSYSGSVLAAYHPGIKHEMCEGRKGRKGCCAPPPDSETDPTKARQDEFVVFGSRLPKVIHEAAMSNFIEDPTRLLECQRQVILLYIEEFERGRLTDAEVTLEIEHLLNMKALSVNQEDGTHVWLLVIARNHFGFPFWSDLVREEAGEGTAWLVGNDENVVIPMSSYFRDQRFDELPLQARTPAPLEAEIEQAAEEDKITVGIAEKDAESGNGEELDDGIEQGEEVDRNGHAGLG